VAKKKGITEENVQATEDEEKIPVGEQMDLIDVGPENLEKIAPHARKYRAAMKKRLAALDIEVKEKSIIQQLVHESGLKRLADGSIKFKCEGMRIEIIPSDEKIKIKDEEE
jgi:redox-regulated HSP33 family molecular chaperone